MGQVVRGLIVLVGILLMVAGLGVITGLPALGGFVGLELVAMGAFLVVVVAIERQRYRSAAAEVSNAPSGPGGGEPSGAPVEPRFRPTSEQFIDPTTNVPMRVLVDPMTGERRYVAEG
ncbi:MAG TPA: hypothetical protein VFI15_09930 [Candidatus Limnocylindrales bacterium]|nr:hypothetical protein [Candidatus Limnocylindrales bacterium]